VKPAAKLALLVALLVIMVAIAHVRGLLQPEVAGELAFRAQQWVRLPSTPKLDALGHPIDRREKDILSIEARLLYTTLLGRPYGLASEDLYTAKLDKNLSGAGGGLAIAARTALRIPDPQSFNSHKALVDFLSGVTEPYEITGLPADFPAPMRADDLAMLHVYSMVMAGQAEAAVDSLSKYLESKSRFTRAFSIMALRAVGSPKAREAIKTRAESDDSMLAQAALAFSVPNFSEPKFFEWEVMPVDRFREPMLAQAQLNTTKAILPTFLLTFVGPDAERAQIDRELEFLRGLHKTADQALWRKYMYGYSALAFRSREPFEQWLSMYRTDKDASRRSFVLRAMSTQHPDRFHAEMLPLFEKETDAWTQLEFLAIYSGLIEGQVLYGPFDAIWFPPVYYRIRYPAVEDAKKKRSVQPFIDLWASGRFPPDKNCPQCRQSWIQTVMRAQDEPMFVKGVLALKERNEHVFGALGELTQVRLAPVIKYIAEREQDPAVRKAGLNAYERLLRNTTQGALTCCEATEECLRQKVAMSPVKSDAPIKSDADAAAFLDRLTQGIGVEITFTDALKRRAIVKQPAVSQDPQTYEHWLGCWRREGEQGESK
jgi:hypothetical protein